MEEGGRLLVGLVELRNDSYSWKMEVLKSLHAIQCAKKTYTQFPFHPPYPIDHSEIRV